MVNEIPGPTTPNSNKPITNVTSRTVDYQQTSYDELWRIYMKTHQIYGIRVVEIGQVLEKNVIILRKAFDDKYQDRELYAPVKEFVDTYQAICNQLSALDGILDKISEIINRKDGVQRKPPGGPNSSDDANHQMTSRGIDLTELARTLSKYFTNKKDVTFLCGRANKYEGLDDLRSDSAEIASDDIQVMLFNIAQYCKVRDRIPELLTAAAAERDTVPEILGLEATYKRSREGPRDAFQ